MLTLTENARATVEALTDNASLPGSGGLRIAASPAEQGGFEIGLVAGPVPGDAVVEVGSTNIYLEATARDALADQELDADPANVETGFTVAPQA